MSDIISTLIRGRDAATRIRDWSLVREFDVELARHGVRVVNRVEDGPEVYERAVNPPTKRGPGRPRKVPAES